LPVADAREARFHLAEVPIEDRHRVVEVLERDLHAVPSDRPLSAHCSAEP
jgi:hypothetical protein